MQVRVQRLCVCSSAAGLALVFAALLAASWFPIPSPNHPAAYIARYYRTHADAIRLASVLLAAGAALLAPIAAVIAVQLRRIEGEASALAYLELGMGSASPLAVSIVSFFWWTAAFRPDRTAVVTQSWNDAGWLCFVATVFIVIVQIAAVATAAFLDPSERPLFPRWLAYLSAWVAVLLVPSVLCLWFKTGPFSWDGVFTLYLALAAAGGWFVTMIVLLLRRLSAEAAAPAPA